MSDQRVCEEIKELEITYRDFNLRIGSSLFFSLNFILQSKIFYYAADDPTPIFFWLIGMIGIFPIILMMALNLHNLLLILRLEKRLRANQESVP